MRRRLAVMLVDQRLPRGRPGEKHTPDADGADGGAFAARPAKREVAPPRPAKMDTHAERAG